MIRLKIDTRQARIEEVELVTSGSVGMTVKFEFSEDWDGLHKTAVFSAGPTTRDVILDSDTAVIPHEVLTVPNQTLRIGVYGTNQGGSVVIPTIYAIVGSVRPGADPSGDPGTDPTLPVWAQILNKIGDLDELDTETKENLVAAINEIVAGGVSTKLWYPTVADGVISWEQSDTDVPPTPEDITGPAGETPVKGVDYFTAAEIAEIEADAAEAALAEVPAWAKQPTKPSYTASEVGALPDDTVIPTALSQLSADSTHRTVTDTEKSTWNGKGTYTKPSGGIPKTDLASAVQTSLGLADSALQSVPSTYRTASAQDTIDNAQNANINGKEAKGKITIGGVEKTANTHTVTIVTNGVTTTMTLVGVS